MLVKHHDEEMSPIVFPIMNCNQKPLRKVVSDVTSEMLKIGKDLEAMTCNLHVEDHDHDSSDEDEDENPILQAECQCCGLKEECTKQYISRIRKMYSGKWVCGLCSEAVKERLEHGERPMANIEEAVTKHTKFLREFNNTTRLNPKLSLTSAMRDIARRSGENRRKNLGKGSKIMRSSSCVPKIDIN